MKESPDHQTSDCFAERGVYLSCSIVLFGDCLIKHHCLRVFTDQLQAPSTFKG